MIFVVATVIVVVALLFSLMFRPEDPSNLRFPRLKVPRTFLVPILIAMSIIRTNSSGTYDVVFLGIAVLAAVFTVLRLWPARDQPEPQATEPPARPV